MIFSVKSITSKKNKGASLIEVVVATAIILLVLSSLYGANIFYLQTVLSNLNKVKAYFLLEEGVEAVKLIRDANWTNISSLPTGTYRYLSWDGTMWQSSTVNIYEDNLFERKFILENVNRDTNGRIVSSGGTLDTGTKKVTATVSWRQGSATSSKSISTYITNFVQ